MLLTRRMDFSASYRDALGATHGHNYVLEVTVSGTVNRETGMVLDLKDLKELLAREIEARFDHRSLSDDTPHFSDRVATPENTAVVIFELLDRALPGGALERIRLSPNDDWSVEVTR